jgi:hypothetical protein
MNINGVHSLPWALVRKKNPHMTSKKFIKVTKLHRKMHACRFLKKKRYGHDLIVKCVSMNHGHRLWNEAFTLILLKTFEEFDSARSLAARLYSILTCVVHLEFN